MNALKLSLPVFKINEKTNTTPSKFNTLAYFLPLVSLQKVTSGMKQVNVILLLLATLNRSVLDGTFNTLSYFWS